MNVTLLDPSGRAAAGPARPRRRRGGGDGTGRPAAASTRPEIGLDRARDAGVTGARLAEITRRTSGPRAFGGTLAPARRHVHAMMDCSDGLATDLAHVCRAGWAPACDSIGSRSGGGARRHAVGGDAREWGRAAARTTSSCSPVTLPRRPRRGPSRRRAPPHRHRRTRGAARSSSDADGATVLMRGGYEHSMDSRVFPSCRPILLLLSALPPAPRPRTAGPDTAEGAGRATGQGPLAPLLAQPNELLVPSSSASRW